MFVSAQPSLLHSAWFLVALSIGASPLIACSGGGGDPSSSATGGASGDGDEGTGGRENEDDDGQGGMGGDGPATGGSTGEGSGGGTSGPCEGDEERTIACGTNDNGFLDQSCEDGEWVDQGECDNAFVTVWDTNVTAETGEGQIQLPLVSDGEYDFDVDWGDGTTTHITSRESERVHTYETPGVYFVTMTGKIKGWSFPDMGNKFVGTGDANKLLEVKRFGPLEFGPENGGQFAGAWSLQISADDAPGLSGADLSSAFSRCHMLTDVGNAEAWDLSSVTDMSQMFWQAHAFNDDLSSWDVSNVTNMAEMFTYAVAFNGDIGGWDVSNVTNMEEMFGGAEAFKQDIGDWDVSKVTNMNEMFARNRFNGDISGWDVGNVTTMYAMFDVNDAFNQDIGGWDVSSVEEMSYMFRNALAFNQDIGGWDVSSVEYMSSMFESARDFDQDLGAWDVSKVTDFSDFFDGLSSLSTPNYDSLLLGWSELSLTSGATFDAGASKYSAAAVDARAELIGAFEWTVTDGGLAE